MRKDSRNPTSVTVIGKYRVKLYCTPEQYQQQKNYSSTPNVSANHQALAVGLCVAAVQLHLHRNNAELKHA